MGLMKKHPIYSVIENIKTDLQTNPENLDKYLNTHRLANIGKIVGGISHAFNNILGGILGYSQLLKEELSQDSDPYRHAFIIEKAAKRASKLISQLYIYSNSKHTFQKFPIDLRTLVQEVIAILSSTFNRHVIISSEFNHQTHNILADFSQMCQVLINVCMNAKEAMPDGGKLCIQTYVAANEEIEDFPEFDRKAEYIVINIKDNGTGIKKEHLPHIFKPYFSTKESSLGNGFGLTIVEGIVKDHHGVLKVSSEPGKGTSVKIYLPTTRVSAIIKKAPVRRKCVQGKGEVILVVDDEIDIREMTKKILEKKGFKVLLADSGHNAIKIYEENAKAIQLVILDLILPGIDGTEVYNKLKNTSTKPKFILTSGYTKILQNREIMKKSSTDCFLPKPWELPTLIKEVKRLLKEP